MGPHECLGGHCVSELKSQSVDIHSTLLREDLFVLHGVCKNNNDTS